MPRLEETVINDSDLLDHAVHFAKSNQFEDAIEQFRQKHRRLFLEHHEQRENEKTGEPEQSHEMYTAFNEYQQLIEDLFDDFVHTHKVSMKEFYDSFHAVVEGHCTALFEEHRNQWFVDMLISWTEYEEFVHLMCNEVKKVGPGLDTDRTYK